MFDRRLLQNFDWLLLFLTLLICTLGIMTIHSASKGATVQSAYWVRQIYWVILGLSGGLLVLLVDFRVIGRLSYLVHGAVVVALGLLPYLGIGASGAGVNRWFLIGPIAVQPSEFAKISTILAVAYYFRDARRVGDVGLRGLVIPALLVLVPFFLIVKQPDLGTALILLILFIPLILMAGLRVKIIVWMGVTAVIGIGLVIAAFQLGYYQPGKDLSAQLRRKGASAELVSEARRLTGTKFAFLGSLREDLSVSGTIEITPPLMDWVEKRTFKPYISYLLRPYQQRRLITFVDPGKDPLGAGYHVIQSKVAIGSGKLTGKGYGESTQGSLNFLPARHTDFIFSIFAEEWGFLGVTGLLGVFTALVLRALSLIFQTTDRFSAFLTLGISSLIGLQVLINILMAVGFLPVVGVPLPFFSYGGSSMVSVLIGLALILNIRMRRFDLFT